MANYFANSTVGVVYTVRWLRILCSDQLYPIQLPEGCRARCPVDDTNLFPPLSGNTTNLKR